ncbi:unnamed protein product [Echinostoma caproni]|uniref:DUF4524 domain-containing protein n=1 Tax=Echinostoma caproni TaxID=27848 RepID=A0A183AN81_9TREM|nr:unnamed protein product [Echinostoma caproni]
MAFESDNSGSNSSKLTQHPARVPLHDENAIIWPLSPDTHPLSHPVDTALLPINPNSTSFIVHYPDLVPRPNGTLRIQLSPDFIIMPDRVLDKGKPEDPFQNRLSNVLITLMDSTGRVLYHRCHFSGPLDRLSKSFQPDGTCWRDHVNALDCQLWEDHFAEVLNQATRWCTPPSPLADIQATLDQEDHPPGQPTVAASRPIRILLNGPVYRVHLDDRWFFLHTFSLPVRPMRLGDTLSLDRTPDQSSSVRLTVTEGVLQEPLSIHYHSLLRECESEKDVISGSVPTSLGRSQCDTTAVAWSTASPVSSGSTLHLGDCPTTPRRSNRSGTLYVPRSDLGIPLDQSPTVVCALPPSSSSASNSFSSPVSSSPLSACSVPSLVMLDVTADVRSNSQIAGGHESSSYTSVAPTVVSSTESNPVGEPSVNGYLDQTTNRSTNPGPSQGKSSGSGKDQYGER